jgi:hypothetical protein
MPIVRSGRGFRRVGNRQRRRASRAVSDVVGTILLLALTVTLFASVFFFITTFPRPPAQPASQFSAKLAYSGTSITFLSVTHLAGPTLGSNTQFYLFSSAKPNAFSGIVYTLANGLNGSTSWSLGQVWNLNITSKGLTSPDNVSVSIVSMNQLLFRQTLPGNNPNIPPEFVATSVTPTNPAVGAAFTIAVQITDDDLNANSVFVNISQLPGVSGTGLHKMTLNAGSGFWSYSVGSGTTTSSGTFYVFVNATDKAVPTPFKNSVAISVTIGGGGSSGGGSSGLLSVVLSGSTNAPVNNTALTLFGTVFDSASVGGTVSVQFFAAGVSLGTGTSAIGAGGTATVSQAWTPAAVGTVLLSATATLSGAGSATGTINVTVFPKILLIGHATAAGSQKPYNESALLATELTAAGYPFSFSFVACGSALPSSATYNSYGVVIIDFGSETPACQTAPSTADQNAITGATSVSFWVVGANGFSSTSCGSYTGAYMALFGISTGGGTCITVVGSSSSATYTSTPSVGLRSDGVGSLTINQTQGGSSAFTPYTWFKKGVTNTAWLQDGSSHPVGSYAVSAGHGQAALATDPALLTVALPNGNSWGSGPAGTQVVYNVVNFLCGLSTSSGTGRALPDFGVSGTVVLGLSHSGTTTIYVGVRSNGPTSGVVTALLYINGSLALFNGQPVSGLVSVGANGANGFITLTWEAPGAATYTLSVVIQSSTGDLYPANNQLPTSVVNRGTVFT